MGDLTSALGPAWLREVVMANRGGHPVGMFSVCSAHPVVLAAAMRQAEANGSMLSIESTSNQVNQFGGYTSLTPPSFAEFISGLAEHVGLNRDRILLGGDHLGPYPWRYEKSDQALSKAGMLVRECVLAGYTKIHLDASMRCADDDSALSDETIAERAARLCLQSEKAYRELPAGSPLPHYVIGSEVPVPGGEQTSDTAPQTTSVDQVRHTLHSFQQAFFACGLQSAWERVIALVVQTGAEFGDMRVFDYDSERAASLAANLPVSPTIVYEAHSTDYQRTCALRSMVRDHFAILKVGPWLTFAYREAILALSLIERDWLGGRRHMQISKVRQALDDAMLRNPSHWQPYYSGLDEAEQAFSRLYSHSDRCRYYWSDAAVKREVDLLLRNLSVGEIPLTLVSQYFPEQYEYIRESSSKGTPEILIDRRVRRILDVYSRAVTA